MLLYYLLYVCVNVYLFFLHLQKITDMSSTSKNSASPIENYDRNQQINCVNICCTHGNGLVPAFKMVCTYYHVKFEAHKKVIIILYLVNYLLYPLKTRITRTDLDLFGSYYLDYYVQIFGSGRVGL